ncbi:hypothetical protein DW757_09405 [Clostridium sp. AM29-11AC]|nr:hypothetical protein DW757_09405 [Clostridium sp. AM29-11AC]
MREAIGGQWKRAGSRTGKSLPGDKKSAAEKSLKNWVFRGEGRKHRGQGHRKRRENVAGRKMRRIPGER